MENFRIIYGFRSAQLYFLLFLGFVVPLCIGYAIYTRTLEDFIKYGGGIAGFLSLMIHLWLPTYHYRRAIAEDRPMVRPPFKKLVIFSYGASLISIPLGAVYYSLAAVLIDAWGNVRNWEALIAQRPVALAIGALAVFTVGLLFFWFRLRARFIYGVSEALAGVAFAVHRLSHEPVIALPSDNSFYFAMLTAGVYLVVRGLDNMHQAWKDQTDPLAKALFRLGTQSDLVEIPPRRLKSSLLTKRRRRGTLGNGLPESVG